VEKKGYLRASFVCEGVQKHSLCPKEREAKKKREKRTGLCTERKQNKEKWEQRSTASRLADKVPYTSEKEGHQPL